MLLTEQEAAAIARVSLKTIRRLIASGKLDALNYGTGGRALWRIPRDALLRVQPAHTITAAISDASHAAEPPDDPPPPFSPPPTWDALK